MATIPAFVEAAKQALLAAAPGIVEQQAQTLLALRVLDIQTNGLGVPYSTRRVPAFFFYNKALNAAGRAYVKQKSKQKNPKDRTGTWEEFKQAQGYGSASVNLTYSGRTLRSLTTIGAGQQGTQFYARIVAADQQGARIIGYLFARYGDFLAPNAAEAAEVAKVGQVAVERIINQEFQRTE